jgi:CCR4-NOT transcriptional regulation complex NOT5 subunit
MYMFCLFTFVFFFERSMQIPIKIPTGSIEDNEIEYFTFRTSVILTAKADFRENAKSLNIKHWIYLLLLRSFRI